MAYWKLVNSFVHFDIFQLHKTFFPLCVVEPNLIPDFAILPKNLYDWLLNMKIILLLSIFEVLKSVTYLFGYHKG